MEKISEHLSYEEIVHSDVAKRYGVKNIPSESQLCRIKLLALNIFEPLRNHFGVPIYVSSCFRTKTLNTLIHGADNSQHMANNGAAMDLDAELFKGVTNKELFEYIKDNLPFDQLIWEFGTVDEPDWVHVSYNSENNRKEMLKAFSINSQTQYVKYNS